MPIYPYDCEDEECETSWEIICSFEDKPKSPSCPCCSGPGRFVFTASNIIFKGPGWETNRAKAAKYAKEGMDKDTARDYYNTSIKHSKEFVENAKTTDYYKPMAASPDHLKDIGVDIKPTKSKEAKRKIAKELRRKK